jgi:hypothetical protein
VTAIPVSTEFHSKNSFWRWIGTAYLLVAGRHPPN